MQQSIGEVLPAQNPVSEAHQEFPEVKTEDSGNVNYVQKVSS